MLHLKLKNQMIPTTTPLLGFSGEISLPLGKISLMVTLGDEEHSTSAQMNFMVVRSSSLYNGIISHLGRMPKWKFELEEFDITYRPRTSIRGQILADFIVEKPDEEGPSIEVQAEEAIPEPWTPFTDRSSCLEGSGAGLILTSPEGPFPEGQGKVDFLIVAIDYFTKWIEAKPVATITGNQVKKFV
nr:reverse transcriptase domain-containing protein [Tanacetum cinerariifolium]